MRRVRVERGGGERGEGRGWGRERDREKGERALTDSHQEKYLCAFHWSEHPQSPGPIGFPR